MFIYEPKGRAKEYSPYALNIYSGCSHHCSYCYCQTLQPNFHSIPVQPRKNILESVAKELAQDIVHEQVLLCFSGDPYCHAEMEFGITRQILEMFLAHKVPAAILTKGGQRCLKDLDLFKKFKSHIKIGATLTFDNEKDSLAIEPGATTPSERIKTLLQLHNEGIRTWISLEPVMSLKSVLNIIDQTHEFVDEYKLGRLNHFQFAQYPVNTLELFDKAVEKFQKYKCNFYIKHDLWNAVKEITTTKVKPSNLDPDVLTLKPWITQRKLV